MHLTGSSATLFSILLKMVQVVVLAVFIYLLVGSGLYEMSAPHEYFWDVVVT